nr:hypothetical protein CFP56_70803 [Quercus suber]
MQVRMMLLLLILHDERRQQVFDDSDANGAWNPAVCVVPFSWRSPGAGEITFGVFCTDTHVDTATNDVRFAIRSL